MTFQSFCSQLEDKIKASYETGTTIEDAEKLAAEFLGAMMKTSEELKTRSLDARMRKSGLKAIRAALYLKEVQTSEGSKKPTESNLAAILDANDVIVKEQENLDTAEIETEELERLFGVFQHAHVYYRGLARGGQ